VAHRRNAVIGALVVVAVAAIITAFSVTPPSPHATAPTSASTGPRTPSNGPTPTPASRQTMLPFTGLNVPGGVAVDTAGDVYVADRDNNRVVKLAAGSNTPTVLPFTGLHGPPMWRWIPPAPFTSPITATTRCSNWRRADVPLPTIGPTANDGHTGLDLTIERANDR
jgi:hypothetical protein